MENNRFILVYYFIQLNDSIFVADCVMTKGVSYGTACPEQIQVCTLISQPPKAWIVACGDVVGTIFNLILFSSKYLDKYGYRYILVLYALHHGVVKMNTH